MSIQLFIGVWSFVVSICYFHLNSNAKIANALYIICHMLLTHWGLNKNGQHHIFKCILCKEIFLYIVSNYGGIGSGNALVSDTNYLNQCWPRCPMPYSFARTKWVNTFGRRQNGRHFADDLFKCIFLNENVWISNKISLKFVPKGSINNIPALVQFMAWRRPGDKPLSEPMMVRLLTHTCHSASMSYSVMIKVADICIVIQGDNELIDWCGSHFKSVIS